MFFFNCKDLIFLLTLLFFALNVSAHTISVYLYIDIKDSDSSFYRIYIKFADSHKTESTNYDYLRIVWERSCEAEKLELMKLLGGD